MNQDQIRNFCIIAHIDHGKSTLADRFLEYTGTVSKRDMREQVLDQMDIERERGITIKLAPVRMEYRSSQSTVHSSQQKAGQKSTTENRELMADNYILNLIDTPGHVDFVYEVSRSLAACEGAILLVDAAQGVQAQTIGNLYLAIEQGLTIIPVVNKIDLPNAEVEKTRDELVHLLGCNSNEVLYTSGKTGQGMHDLFEAIIKRVPPPKVKLEALPRALIFDSVYDEYRGIVAYVRVVDGSFSANEKIHFMATGKESEVIEVGYFKPKYEKTTKLLAGEIGYIVTGFKNILGCRVGDTLTISNFQFLTSNITPLPGYKEIKSMVFAGIFPKAGDAYLKLREAMEKLQLNDAALTFEPETSGALGFGFRVGLLGLLHLEIVQERLEREYGLAVIMTVPSVAYKVMTTDKKESVIKNPQDLPDQSRIVKIEEPWVRADIVSPREYIGAIMQLVSEKRGIYKNTEYLSSDVSGGRVLLHYDVPLASILVDFYDKLKSASSGYASLSYEFIGYREASVARLEILVAEEPVDALLTIVYRDASYDVARRIVDTLKEALPRQQFEVKIQAAIGGKIIASSRLPALRKDVTAKLYGGDVTRKMKLLQKQKKGKKKMRAKGHVEIPPEAYLAVLKR